jgi:seryl-tRNA synthetase
MDDTELHRARVDLQSRLVDAGLLIPTGFDGLYGRNAVFESVVRAIDAQVCAIGASEHPEAVEFPPLLPRETFDRIGYLQTFPQLAGVVFAFDGDDRAHAGLMQQIEHGEPYASSLSQSEVVLTPACCYPVYPSASGRLPDGGRVFELRTYCFRNEPSVDPMRMVAFRQLEHVRLGTAEQVQEWRATWMQRAPEFLADLGIAVSTDVANDPFFGRAGRLMASAQREQELKYEFGVPVYAPDELTACASLNYHQEHFGHLFGITAADGADAHSSCIGFGLERCTIALFARHGTNVADWPERVRTRLWG